MFCSSCGVAVAKGLSFCSFCGGRIGSTESGVEFREIRPQTIVGAMVALFVLGLPGITFLIFMLNGALHLDPGLTVAFAWVSLLLLVALEAVFTLLLLRRKSRKDEGHAGNQLKGPQTNELDSRLAAQLPQSVPSVTEHTTHRFDPIPRERS